MGGSGNMYVAGMGVITPVGATTEMTVAAVKAGISAYQISDFFTKNQQPITMARVPGEVFTSLDVEIEEGNIYGEVYDHIIKMSILALREVFAQVDIKKPIPLILSLPESNTSIDTIPLELLTKNIIAQKDLPIEPSQIRSISTGRAGVIQSLELAQRYLNEMDQDFVVIGGADSFLEYPVLQYLDNEQRLNATGSMDGFAPGEGAGFLLVTRYAGSALNINNKIISLSAPGVAQEPGHLKSEENYLGEGLDLSFKQALKASKLPVTRVYTSMNGERFWAKENGVAMMRNKKYFHDEVITEHPADCYGELGCSTGAVLIALSANQLFNETSEYNHLVYTSSDNEWRSSVIVNKINIPN